MTFPYDIVFRFAGQLSDETSCFFCHYEIGGEAGM
jgi:hypothetical protein